MKTKILIQLETWGLSMDKVGVHEDLDKVRALSYKAISKAAKYENDSVLNSEILLSISLRNASTCEDLLYDLHSRSVRPFDSKENVVHKKIKKGLVSYE